MHALVWLQAQLQQLVNLQQLEAQARAWNGLISVAVFVKSPETDLPSIAELHARLLENTNAGMEITLVHALQEADASEYDRLYPINALVRGLYQFICTR